MSTIISTIRARCRPAVVTAALAVSVAVVAATPATAGAVEPVDNPVVWVFRSNGPTVAPQAP